MLAKPDLKRRIRWFFIRPIAQQLDRLEIFMASALSDIVAKLATDTAAALAAKDKQIADLTAKATAADADAADAEAAVTALTALDATVAPTP